MVSLTGSGIVSKLERNTGNKREGSNNTSLFPEPEPPEDNE